MEPCKPLLWEYGTKSPIEMPWGLRCSWSLPQSCAEVSAAPKCDYPISQISKHPECTSIPSGAFRSTWECSCRVSENLLSSRTAWKHLEVLESTNEVKRNVWEDCVLLPDQFTISWFSTSRKRYIRLEVEWKLWIVLATVPVLDPAGIIGLRGNGLTPSKIDDFLRESSL